MPREKIKCGNPLWRDWIQEWADQARDKQLKTYYTYKKAADNLAKCPLEFSHPAEAIQIKGIGEGLVKRLERQLEKHCRENGLPMPEHPISLKRKAGTQASTQDDGTDGEPSKKRRTRTKAYVPRYRTGGYAIMLSMLEHLEDNLTENVSKDQIIELAERHCDSSFDLVESGKNYTAWNSMRTLIDKDLVWKNGQPPLYTLTETGITMAQELRNSSTSQSQPANSNTKQPSATSRKKKTACEDDDSSDLAGEDEIDLSLYVLDPSKYQPSTKKDDPLDDNELDEILNISEQSPSDNILSVDDGGDRNAAEVLDLSPSPLAPPLSTASPTPTPTRLATTAVPVPSYSNSAFEYTYVNRNGEAVRHVSQAAFDIDESGRLMHKIRFSAQQRAHEKAKMLHNVRQDDKSSAADSLTAYILEDHASVVCPGLPKRPLLPLGREEEDDFWPNTASQQSQMNSSQTDEGYTMYPPDSYDIVLLLDTREIKMKSRRDYFLEQLTEKGIHVAKRALELGDMIWVAQKRGSKSQSDELFLDIIVERKRLDDLVTSIKDGRFHEQKRRLQRSGAQKVIYIVEEFNKDEVMQFGAQAIQTAMSSTQVVDGFFLKRTATISDTVDYLVNVTKMVQKMYEGATLYKIPDHAVTRQAYLEQKTRLSKMHLISYPLFGILNNKSDTLTLHDVYVRMLMATRGVSAEKAKALTKIYPTPHALLTAYASVDDEIQGKTLARERTKDGIMRRRWNSAVSEKLWQVWGRQQY